MRSVRMLLFAFAVIPSVVQHTAVAQEITPACLVLPVETELHQQLLGKETAAYVILNGDAIVNDHRVDATLLDVNALQKRLEQCRKAGRTTAQVNMFLSRGRFAGTAGPLISAAVRETGRAAGFTAVHYGETSTNDMTTWKDYVGLLGTKPDQGDEEAVAEKPTFIAYPVRTRLSRLLTGGADLVVDVKLHFDGKQDAFESTSLIPDIANVVPTINLAAQNKVLFRIHATADGRAAQDRFVQKEGQGLAELVGFKYARIQVQYE